MFLQYPQDFMELVARTACANMGSLPLDIQAFVDAMRGVFREVLSGVQDANIAGKLERRVDETVTKPDGSSIKVYKISGTERNLELADPTICPQLEIIFPHAPAGLGMAASTRGVAAPKRLEPEHSAVRRHINLPRTIRKPMRTALTNRPLFVTELVEKIIKSQDLQAITLNHRFDVANQIAKTIDGIEFVFVLEGPDSNKVKHIPK